MYVLYLYESESVICGSCSRLDNLKQPKYVQHMTDFNHHHMWFSCGNGAPPPNTSGISHTPQLPWDISIIYPCINCYKSHISFIQCNLWKWTALYYWHSHCRRQTASLLFFIGWNSSIVGTSLVWTISLMWVLFRSQTYFRTSSL